MGVASRTPTVGTGTIDRKAKRISMSGSRNGKRVGYFERVERFASAEVDDIEFPCGIG